MIKIAQIDRRWIALGLGLILVAADRALAHLLGLEPLLRGVAGEGGLLLAWAVGHCDTLDGPVVTLARKAYPLARKDRPVQHARDVALGRGAMRVLRWVNQNHWLSLWASVRTPCHGRPGWRRVEPSGSRIA